MSYCFVGSNTRSHGLLPLETSDHRDLLWQSADTSAMFWVLSCVSHRALSHGRVSIFLFCVCVTFLVFALRLCRKLWCNNGSVLVNVHGRLCFSLEYSGVAVPCPSKCCPWVPYSLAATLTPACQCYSRWRAEVAPLVRKPYFLLQPDLVWNADAAAFPIQWV